MRPTRRRLAPRDQDHQAAPPRPPESGARGPGRGYGNPPPSSPYPPRPADSRRPTSGAAAPHPPREGRGTQGGTPQPWQALLHAECPAVPAAGRQLCAGAQGGPIGRGGTAALRMQYGGRGTGGPPSLVPARGRRGNEPRPSPWGGAARRRPPPPRQGDPRTACHAAPGAWGCPTTPAEQVYPRRMRRRRRGAGSGATGLLPGEGRRGTTAGPLLPSPPTPPSGLRATGAPGLHPRQTEGTSPLPPKGAAAPGGGTQLSPHAPDRLLSRGPRQASESAPAHEDDARTTPRDNTRTRT